jgi:hypothetical protein
MVGSRPAMAGGPYGCRGDQACVKIAETTLCDPACQQVCKEYRFDYAMCYSVWSPSACVSTPTAEARYQISPYFGPMDLTSTALMPSEDFA